MQEAELRKGPWLEEEDDHLAAAVAVLGDKRWDALAKASGIKRSGKSCRLRWMNYLRPNLKHGNISVEEERIIIELHQKWGNRWSKIARRLPGRTDNEIKNYWRSYSKKKAILLEKECSSSATKSPCDPMKEEDASGPSDDHAMAALSLTRSPYETRLTEWMSNWPPDIYRTTESRDELLNYDVYSPQWDLVCRFPPKIKVPTISRSAHTAQYSGKQDRLPRDWRELLDTSQPINNQTFPEKLYN